jgi:hypothetical protein
MSLTRNFSTTQAFLVKDITKTIHEGLVKHLNFYRDLFSCGTEVGDREKGFIIDVDHPFPLHHTLFICGVI